MKSSGSESVSMVMFTKMEIDMMKIRKNSKVQTWEIYGSGGANEYLGSFTFYREEVKAFFPGCRIVKRCVFLA